MIYFFDANVWRGGSTEFFGEVKRQQMIGKFQVACSSSVAFECATAKEQEMQIANLKKILDHTTVWLKDYRQVFKGIVHYLQFGWTNNFDTTLLPSEARREECFWSGVLGDERASFRSELRTHRVAAKLAHKRGSIDAREHLLELIDKHDYQGPQSFDSGEERVRYINRCFDPEDDECKGLLFGTILSNFGLAESSLDNLLRCMGQFLGLKLFAGHLINSHLNHIAGKTSDDSFLSDALLLPSISENVVFVTNDASVIESFNYLNCTDYVCGPSQLFASPHNK